MLTLQQIFDQTLEKLNQTGRVQSVAIGGKCAYRGNDGAKCAVGLWIPDDMYNPSWENMGMYGLSMCNDFVEMMASVGINTHPQSTEGELLNDLQRFHDNYLGPRNSYESQIAYLANMANYYGLTFNSSQWENLN